ncbi:hypothetical protein [Nocardioides sp. 1609]|uniref:hypothetical protein n=1 Tax=Nocardioides sp. 1609 TaxID=2508327 RepID=UPI00106F3C65|nr:hypothetical protein [Nocardioides sp. 1609]
MSNTNTINHDHTRRISSETKASFKTTELIVFALAVVGVLVASAMSDGASDFGPKEAWFLVTLLAIGYMISRGLAKSGSRDFFDDGSDTDRR